jgi:virulence-associated protein VapD
VDTLVRDLPELSMEAPPPGRYTIYAIAFDLDPEALRDVRDALREHGFVWQQGSVYFGDDSVTPVTCVLAMQDLAGRFPWLQASARDMRMLRIEENNDLRPAIESV